MPRAKEFTITIADTPGALGRCFSALGDAGINILAFQSFVEEGESLARMVVDDPPAAKSVLGRLGLIFEETYAAMVELENAPGQLGRAASLLGEHKINIDYSYCGSKCNSGSAIVVFGIDNLTHGAALLDSLVSTKA